MRMESPNRREAWEPACCSSYDCPDTRLTLTVEEAAQMLGISRIKGYELAHSEGFPAMRLGRKLLIPRDRFLAWIDQQAGTAASSGR